MNVLIACEESQAVCKAFREKGHEAYSCDIQECSGGHPEWHIQGDVLDVLNPKHLFTHEGVKGIGFYTCDNKWRFIEGKWDLIIAHPPCTRLCNSGQRWLYWGDEEYRAKKQKEQKEAIIFFMHFANADCDRVAIENPLGIMSTHYRKPEAARADKKSALSELHIFSGQGNGTTPTIITESLSSTACAKSE